MQAIVEGGQRRQHTQAIWLGFDAVQHIVGCQCFCIEEEALYWRELVAIAPEIIYMEPQVHATDFRLPSDSVATSW